MCLLWGGGIAFAQEGTPSRNTLPLSEKNYDPILQHNLVKDRIDEIYDAGIGTEASLELLARGYADEEISPFLFAINVVIGAIAILWLSVSGAKFIFSQGDDERLSKYKTQFGWIILGLATIAVGEFVAFEVLNPSQDVIEGAKTISNFSLKINQIKFFMQIIVGGIMLISMMMSGYNLIVGSEEDEKIEQEKNIFQSFFVGAFLILTAEILARVFGAQDSSGELVAPEQMVNQGVSEIVGLINFALTFVGGATVIMLILSSLYYVISLGNEDQMNRAKRIIISCVIGIIVVLSSYTIIRFMIR